MSKQILTVAEARKLANKIKTNLATLEEDLKFFHAVAGWLPLGYDSFTIWWDNEMGDIPFAVGIRNWAIHAMIAENTVGGRLRPGMTAVMAHATGLKATTISHMKTRARPRVRMQGRKDHELVPLSMVIPNLWHRHLLALSRQKDISMADILRPIFKQGMLESHGVDLDEPIPER